MRQEMRKYSYKTFDPDTGASMEVIIQSPTAPTSETLDKLFSQIKKEFSEAGGQDEEPEISEKMTQRQFEAARAAQEAKKRKARDGRGVIFILGGPRAKGRQR